MAWDREGEGEQRRGREEGGKGEQGRGGVIGDCGREPTWRGVKEGNASLSVSAFRRVGSGAIWIGKRGAAAAKLKGTEKTGTVGFVSNDAGAEEIGRNAGQVRVVRLERRWCLERAVLGHGFWGAAERGDGSDKEDEGRFDGECAQLGSRGDCECRLDFEGAAAEKRATMRRQRQGMNSQGGCSRGKRVGQQEDTGMARADRTEEDEMRK
ncbi:hypothetical protein ERJ75_001706200 [Trypanosoma vivax]|nr:hypothetical protein ERJ75_001706200 [Trypanosoma vivax]